MQPALFQGNTSYRVALLHGGHVSQRPGKGPSREAFCIQNRLTLVMVSVFKQPNMADGAASKNADQHATALSTYMQPDVDAFEKGLQTILAKALCMVPWHTMRLT